MRVCSLLFVLSLMALGLPHAEAAPSDEEQWADADAFFNAGYTWCDAVHIAGFWGKGEPYDAKVRVGRLARKGKVAKVAKTTTAAREWAERSGSTCEFSYEGYVWDDATAVGALWGASAEEAKARIASLIRQEQWWQVEEAMQKAGRYDDKAYYDDGYYPDDCDPGLAYADPDERVAAYAGYTDGCDVALLAGFWNVPDQEVMRRIGAMIASDGKLRVEQDLASARMLTTPGARQACDYFQSGYGYDDAELLAGLWGVEVFDAKLRMGEMRAQGRDAVLRSLLSTARGY